MRFLIATILGSSMVTGHLAAAQTAGPQPMPPPGTPSRPGSTALSADMEAGLRKAGFTDLQILPDSVLVRGKDKAGHPVAMVLHPGSMTEMITLDPHSGSAAAGDGSVMTGSATFATVLPSEKLLSKIVGTTVTSAKGDVLGTIRDIAVDHGGIQAYIIQVAGVLGIGERLTAVTPTAITLTPVKGEHRYRASMDATPDQMKAAPPFDDRQPDEATK